MVASQNTKLHYALKEIIVDTFTHKRALVNKIQEK